MPRFLKIPQVLDNPGRLFLTTFAVPTEWKFPERFDPGNYSGMYLCQRLRSSSGDDLLLIWWDAPDCYGAFWSVQLSKDLDVAAKPRFQGSRIEQRPKHATWLSRPTKWIPWLITLVAATVTILGNFTQLENYSAWLLARPNAKISVSRIPVRVIQNEAASSMEFTVHNRSRGTLRIGSH